MNRLLVAALFSLGVVGLACYQDDVVRPADLAPTRVLLTDDPFPFDSVAEVNVYVSRIEANSQFDTTGAGDWVEVAAPHAIFNLLTLQQGVTAFVGSGTLDAGRYAAIRMTIDVDQSSITYLDGSQAVVHWPYPGQGEIPLYARVEEPLAVSPAGGAEIVIDFDVGRSFLYNLYGLREFVLGPSYLRAVNSAATGALSGTVTARDTGGLPALPIRNANVTVFYGYSGSFASTNVAATGRSDAQGNFTVAFLSAGTYTVRVEQPDMPWLAAVDTYNVAITAGATTPLSVELPPAGAGVLHVTGPTSVYVGGQVVLRAAVVDSSGQPVGGPTISWFSRDPSTAITLDSAYADTIGFVLGLQTGSTWIVATSGSLADSVPMQVLPPPSSNPVASVTVSPPSLNLSVGDSTVLQATVRDSAGTELTDRQIFWYPADSSGIVDLVVSVGPTATLKARSTGTTTIRAVSEGKTGSATVTVQ